jgi:ABC-type transporter lipoprotein component MlaA
MMNGNDKKNLKKITESILRNPYVQAHIQKADPIELIRDAYQQTQNGKSKEKKTDVNTQSLQNSWTKSASTSPKQK